jgi:hypothetical protein
MSIALDKEQSTFLIFFVVSWLSKKFGQGACVVSRFVIATSGGEA